MAQVRKTLALFLIWAVWFTTPAFALDEAPGQDHPLVSRFAGSRLIGYRQVDWDEALFPTSSETANLRWRDLTPVEGRLTRLLYTAPAGKSRLEVHRNYEQALLDAGLEKIAECKSDCKYLTNSLDQALNYRTGMIFAKDPLPRPGSGGYSISNAITNSDVRWFYGVIQRGGAEWHVLVATCLAVNSSMDMATTFIQIVEPEAMQLGQVTVNAEVIRETLNEQGRITLSGLLFDTGKAEIKPESTAQLDEMVAFLENRSDLKVFIVDHTDNVGAIEANLRLSQDRAESVVAALTRRGIAPGRLHARGVANFAPVASNNSEEGRTQNRRVEMVAQ